MSKISTRQVWLPESLQDLRESLDLGLYFLTIGREPEFIPDDKRKNMKVKISDTTVKLLNDLVPNNYKTKNEAILNALSWLSHQPKHCHKAKLETV